MSYYEIRVTIIKENKTAMNYSIIVPEKSLDAAIASAWRKGAIAVKVFAIRDDERRNSR